MIIGNWIIKIGKNRNSVTSPPIRRYLSIDLISLHLCVSVFLFLSVENFRIDLYSLANFISKVLFLSRLYKKHNNLEPMYQLRNKWKYGYWLYN